MMNGTNADQSECVEWIFFFSSRRRHTRFDCDWSSDVCSSDLRNAMWRRHSKDGRTFEWRRHMAFRSQFRLLDGQWCLEITPTYRFTTDGYELRSEERRVGKEGRARWSPDDERNKCRSE